MRVLVAGFKHETNSFAPNLADWAAFERGELLPAASHGAVMIDRISRVNVSLSGFLRVARDKGWTIMPSLWCGAVPSSYITAQAFEFICDTIIADVRKGGFDAIYIDMHGAAMAHNADDADGELLRRIRGVVGDDLPIVASLDLHANVTKAMLDLADGLVAFRTNPHIDYVETGELAAELLDRRIRQGSREKLSHTRLPFLIPVNAQSTTTQPAKSIYELLVRLDTDHGTISSFCMGFPASDFEECAPMIWGYGDEAALTVERLASAALDADRWKLEIYEPRAAVAQAIARTTLTGKPVVIADTQDNPGAGGTASTTGMLHALLAENAGRHFPGQVTIGLLFDEAAAATAVAAGVGATIELAVGASGPTFQGASDPPVFGRYKVRAIADGRFTFKGPKMTGFVTNLGASACLEIEGVLIAVTSARIGAQDRELFRGLGIAPEAMRIIVVKSTNHFRADFAPLVEDEDRDILTAKAAGAMAADPADLPWTKLPLTIRRRP